MPDKIHNVTVPGPIKADVIIRPGPTFFKDLNIFIILLTFQMHHNQGTMIIFQTMD